MDFLFILLTFIAFLFLFLFLAFSFFLLSCFIGNSIMDPKYPPAEGTVFGQILYFNRLYDYQTEQAKTHKTFRLLAPGRSEFYTTDPRNIEHILKTQFEKYTKGKYHEDILIREFLQSMGKSGGSRGSLQAMSFPQVLRDFSCSVFRKSGAKLVGVISEFSDAGVVFDMQDILMRCTLDSIFKVEFGLKRFLNIGSEAKLKKNVKIIDGFVHGLIKTKREKVTLQQDSNDKEDILSGFLVGSKKDPQKMNDQYLRDIILNFLIAGKDTSANTLSWFFYMLCRNPLVQEKVAQEVKDVTGSQEIEANIDEFVAKITEAALEKMHYLHAALTETLRLYPAVPRDGRVAETDDILPDGYRVKNGDAVCYMSYSMGRMTYIWGDDAEEFRPERWLDNGIFQPESPFKFIAFHGGPRTCLGKDFAYRQWLFFASSDLNWQMKQEI
ncbi:putative Cytochrome P450 [Quillaja saponaria]|uniref:Cytochrome P450 n=1 Tax=Quillaja saponaria TaxID=32244 RepID=A0AAD7L465_QUISA|nr:putative Cytochrome P450 [Quillaja saponaria]